MRPALRPRCYSHDQSAATLICYCTLDLKHRRFDRCWLDQADAEDANGVLPRDWQGETRGHHLSCAPKTGTSIYAPSSIFEDDNFFPLRYFKYKSTCKELLLGRWIWCLSGVRVRVSKTTLHFFIVTPKLTESHSRLAEFFGLVTCKCIFVRTPAIFMV